MRATPDSRLPTPDPLDDAAASTRHRSAPTAGQCRWLVTRWAWWAAHGGKPCPFAGWFRRGGASIFGRPRCRGDTAFVRWRRNVPVTRSVSSSGGDGGRSGDHFPCHSRPVSEDTASGPAPVRKEQRMKVRNVRAIAPAVGLVLVAVTAAPALGSPTAAARAESLAGSVASSRWMNTRLDPGQRATQLVGQMTLDEKIAEVHGVGYPLLALSLIHIS